MHKTQLLLLVVIFVIGTLSCKKTTQSGTSFVNNVGIDMNVDIYSSLSDYTNGTNVVAHIRVPVNTTGSIPSSKFIKGQWYYTDTYSDDYSFTNWAQDDSYMAGTDSATHRRIKFGTSNSFSIPAIKTTASISLLNGKKSTTWKAVDALDPVSATSIWGTLSNIQQSAFVVINKDHSGYYYYLDGADTIGLINFTFNNYTFTSPVYVLQPDDSDLHFQLANTTTDPIKNSYYQAPSIDSGIMVLDNKLYVIARE